MWKIVIFNHFPFSSKERHQPRIRSAFLKKLTRATRNQTVNFYNNGTVLIQGNDSSLQDLENIFAILKVEAELISEAEEKVKEEDGGEKGPNSLCDPAISPSVSLYVPHLLHTEPRTCLQHQEHLLCNVSTTPSL